MKALVCQDDLKSLGVLIIKKLIREHKMKYLLLISILFTGCITCDDIESDEGFLKIQAGTYQTTTEDATCRAENATYGGVLQTLVMDFKLSGELINTRTFGFAECSPKEEIRTGIWWNNKGFICIEDTSPDADGTARCYKITESSSASFTLKRNDEPAINYQKID